MPRLPAFLFVLTCLPLFAGEPAVTLRVGVAAADITPGIEVRNWVTGRAYAEVLDPLQVQVLTLDDGTAKAALVRWDLTDVSESSRDEVRRAIEAATGIPGANVMINASHTHSGPWSPVYKDGYRGKERDNWWAVRHMPTQNDYPPFRAWMEKLIAATVDATKRALAGEIGRAHV